MCDRYWNRSIVSRWHTDGRTAHFLAGAHRPPVFARVNLAAPWPHWGDQTGTQRQPQKHGRGCFRRGDVCTGCPDDAYVAGCAIPPEPATGFLVAASRRAPCSVRCLAPLCVRGTPLGSPPASPVPPADASRVGLLRWGAMGTTNRRSPRAGTLSSGPCVASWKGATAPGLGPAHPAARVGGARGCCARHRGERPVHILHRHGTWGGSEGGGPPKERVWGGGEDNAGNWGWLRLSIRRVREGDCPSPSSPSRG